mmetsp:Transcript_96725/g.202143  ORF Transcript_96725/g.202143 Transcript_96725/m.202143 type:complete len:287 (+) Transcript_96725:110-970(+)
MLGRRGWLRDMRRLASGGGGEDVRAPWPTRVIGKGLRGRKRLSARAHNSMSSVSGCENAVAAGVSGGGAVTMSALWSRGRPKPRSSPLVAHSSQEIRHVSHSRSFFTSRSWSANSFSVFFLAAISPTVLSTFASRVLRNCSTWFARTAASPASLRRSFQADVSRDSARPSSSFKVCSLMTLTVPQQMPSKVFCILSTLWERSFIKAACLLLLLVPALLEGSGLKVWVVEPRCFPASPRAESWGPGPFLLLNLEGTADIMPSPSSDSESTSLPRMDAATACRARRSR